MRLNIFIWMILAGCLFSCEKEKLTDRGCTGAPDLIIEIVSPSSRRMDYGTKMALYSDAGVREYWIVDPEKKTVQVSVLDGGRYRLAEVYTAQDVAKINVLEGCFIELSKLFSE